MGAEAAGALAVRRVEPAYAQVASQIRELILTGELRAGERLPAETDLAELFGVSRSTVREALRVLASQDLIVTSRGVTGGSFVAHPQPDHVRDALETALGLLAGSDEVSVGELLEARELLEVPAAELAAARGTADDLVTLRGACAHGASRRPDFEQHRRFHVAVLRAGGNRIVEIVARPIFSVLRTRFLRDDAPRRFWNQVDADHHAIHERIDAGDVVGAGTAMREHLEHLRETYERIDRSGRPARDRQSPS